MASIDHRLSRVVAVSGAAGALAEETLAEIAGAARRHNIEARLTGFLIYRDGEFFHLLEGPGDEIEATLCRIESDDRHRWMTVQLRERPFFRAFRDWRMGVATTGPDGETRPGEARFFEEDGALTRQRLMLDPRQRYYRLLKRFSQVERDPRQARSA